MFHFFFRILDVEPQRIHSENFGLSKRDRLYWGNLPPILYHFSKTRNLEDILGEGETTKFQKSNCITTNIATSSVLSINYIFVCRLFNQRWQTYSSLNIFVFICCQKSHFFNLCYHFSRQVRIGIGFFFIGFKKWLRAFFAI